jgi:signal transduction histidine kinase
MERKSTDGGPAPPARGREPPPCDDDVVERIAGLLERVAAGAAPVGATARTVANEGLRRAVEASERERQRWARELHDETLQELAGLRVLLSGARRSRDLDTLHATLQTALEQIDTEIAGLRRMIADLRPAALDAFGVQPALEGLAERVAATSGLEVELDVDLPSPAGPAPGRLPAETEATVYRLAQEALTNVLKHASARHVAVMLSVRDGVVELTVRDDGRGFDPRAAHDGFGLVGMGERAALAGGTLAVESAPGGGTVVCARLPVPAPAQAPAPDRQPAPGQAPTPPPGGDPDTRDGIVEAAHARRV